MSGLGLYILGPNMYFLFRVRVSVRIKARVIYSRPHYILFVEG